jgi:hypothetical protein
MQETSGQQKKDKNSPRLGELEPLEFEEDQPDNECEEKRDEEREHHNVGSERDGSLCFAPGGSNFFSGSGLSVSRAISSPMFFCSCLGK